MKQLAEEGFVLIAGPLAGSEAGRFRVLLSANASDEPEVHHRLADDPWVQSQRLVTTRLNRGRRWTVASVE